MKLFKNNIIKDNLWCANDNYQLSGDNIIKSSMSMMHNYKWKCYRMEVNVIKVWIELFSWEGQGSNFLPSKIIYFWIQTALHRGSTIEIMNLNFLSWTRLNERHFFSQIQMYCFWAIFFDTSLWIAIKWQPETVNKTDIKWYRYS